MIGSRHNRLNPERKLPRVFHTLERPPGFNFFGVEELNWRPPRVARSEQPWAG
jgi:hypothetical protein